MKIKAYAKVNLALKVINKREDGYHNLSTIMDLISIYDVIYIKKSNDIKFRCSNKDLENDDNLIIKLINILKNEYPVCEQLGACIYLKKNIPLGAGLGGGSSDAAATLLALNKLWKLNLSFEELASIALKLGSDVPFFLLRSLGILSGIGEDIKPIKTNTKLYYLLVFPGYSSYTKDVYQNNEIVGNDLTKVLDMIKAFNNNDTKLVIDNLFNDLTDAAIKINKDKPFIKDIIDDLNNYIIDNKITAKAIMSGSGSTVFAACADKASLAKIYKYAISREYVAKKYRTHNFCKIFL